MNEQILYPSEVTAYRMGNDSNVIITAKGYEDGFTKIKITPSMAAIYPPIYMVVGEPTPAIGMFPYTVQLTVPYPQDLDFVYFQMEHGTQKIPVVDIMQDTKSLPQALVKATTTDNQVTGYAYNSTDISKAIGDAVNKLRVKYPNGINAKVVESGFTAVGSPVGIAFF